MNKKTPIFIALFCAFVQTFISFGDYTPGQLEPNWPVTLGPEEECEEVVAYLKDSVDSIARDLSGWESYYNNLSDSHQQVYEMATDTDFSPAYTNNPTYSQRLDYYNNVFTQDMILLAEDLKYANEQVTNLLDNVYKINCADCVIGDQPEGPTNSNNCCDFTGLYARLDELIRLQTLIESNVQRLRTIDQNLQYSVFLLEHGFGDITNLFQLATFSDYGRYQEYTQYYADYYYHDSPEGRIYPAYYFNLTDNTYIPDFLQAILDDMQSLASLNNYAYYFQKDFNAIKAPSPLLYFDAEVEQRDYYTYLTNYYFAMVRDDSDIAVNHKTNWFTRIETLLAALVFVDGSKSNLTEHVEDSVTNSINDVTESFEDFFEGVSGAPTSQIELVGDVERSMYQSLRQFSSAFSDATMPRSVRVIRVEKNVGSKSVTDVVDVSVEVEGRLLDMIEILRSATTLCWVFAGLFFMFKFSVWTVKKIYLLARYAIDFFNMILGGK